MIFTSYYGNRKTRTEDIKIQISCTSPYKCDGELEIFYPPYELVNGIKTGKISEEEYTKRYLEVLEDRKKDIDTIIPTLKEFSQEKDIVFLCYCSPKSFCHRHILRDWLNKNYNLDIKEYAY